MGDRSYPEKRKGTAQGRSSRISPIILKLRSQRDIARNFRGNLFRKAALHANAWKTANAELSLARGADLIVAHTAEDTKSLELLSPLSAKLVLTPAYNGPRAPDRQIVQATPRHVAIVGNYQWMAKQINLSAFLEAADPILQNAGIGIDIVGEGPDSFRKAWETKVKATRFHGFVDDLSEFLAGGAWGWSSRRRVAGSRTKHSIISSIGCRLPR